MYIEDNINKIDDNIDLDKLNKLFDVMLYMCNLSCGDGDVYLVSGKYLALAKLFEEWLKNNNITYLERWDDFRSYVNFSSGMDCVGFYKNRESLPHFSNGIILGDFIVDIIDGLI